MVVLVYDLINVCTKFGVLDDVVGMIMGTINVPPKIIIIILSFDIAPFPYKHAQRRKITWSKKIWVKA